LTFVLFYGIMRQVDRAISDETSRCLQVILDIAWARCYTADL